jgi:hypothetical protein
MLRKATWLTSDCSSSCFLVSNPCNRLSAVVNGGCVMAGVADFFCAKEREEIKSSSVQILFISGYLDGDENTRKELQVVPSSTIGKQNRPVRSIYYCSFSSHLFFSM